MTRFILASFALLVWLFYEMSGGAAFEPASERLAREQTGAPPESDVPSDTVTRVSLDLTSVEDVVPRGGRVPARLPGTQATETAGPAAEPAPLTLDFDRGETGPEDIVPSLVLGAVPDTLSDPAPAPDTATTSISLTEQRVVTGDRVNVRSGPGVSFGVVGQLQSGDRIEILEDTGTGWVRLRAENADIEGWMADFLLSGG